MYLVGFKNRVTTLMHWAFSFVGRGRSERAVTAQQVVARVVLQEASRGSDGAGSPLP
jgi:NADH dehydrogenase